ncbi:MAG TPA: 16S rRNA (guanine(527)-N(7))-methyltransferase RsmG [Gammaproteobacteria bacterium]|nr:16S rRNA (guanine(527)-N(7))-methyltransferase RsmG [Gammaproteobacteria bacterium]
MADDWRRQLGPGLKALDLTLPPGAEAALLSYVELLARWNQAYNLTAVRDPAEMVSKHLLDSLAILPYVTGPSVADVGTGAGLPGIPLALAQPDIQFTLIDSNGKKTRFVTQAVAELKLKNVAVVQARSEGWQAQRLFAQVVSRAFASLGDFARLAGGLAAPGGRLLAMKGAVPEDELAGLPAGFRVAAVHPLKVPGLDAERCLVELEKT